MRVNVTINLANGDEYSHEQDAKDFSEISEVLNTSLEAQNVTPDQWSSLLVTIVNTSA